MRNFYKYSYFLTSKKHILKSPCRNNIIFQKEIIVERVRKLKFLEKKRDCVAMNITKKIKVTT